MVYRKINRPGQTSCSGVRTAAQMAIPFYCTMHQAIALRGYNCIMQSWSIGNGGAVLAKKTGRPRGAAPEGKRKIRDLDPDADATLTKGHVWQAGRWRVQSTALQSPCQKVAGRQTQRPWGSSSAARQGDMHTERRRWQGRRVTGHRSRRGEKARDTGLRTRRPDRSRQDVHPFQSGHQGSAFPRRR